MPGLVSTIPQKKKDCEITERLFDVKKQNSLRSFQKERHTIANRYKAKQSFHNKQTLDKGISAAIVSLASLSIPPTHQPRDLTMETVAMVTLTVAFWSSRVMI